MSLPKTNELEIRTLAINQLETRAIQENARITGYAVVYNTFTQMRDWFGDLFFERIDNGAMSRTLSDGHDIFALKNHNWDLLVGRTGANLTLENHENGLFFDLSPAQTTLGRDVLEEVRSGLISGCSFGFRVLDQEWEERDGDWFRTIKDIELLEITLTPIPAYSQTTAEVRSLVPNMKITVETPEETTNLEERKAILADVERIEKMLERWGK